MTWGSFCTFGGRHDDPPLGGQGTFLDFAHDYRETRDRDEADGLIRVLAEDETGRAQVWITRTQALRLRDALTEELARPDR